MSHSKTAKLGDKVKVHYKGFFDDGMVFDSSNGQDPLAVHLGEGELISGFESGIPGMEKGEKKTIRIAPDEGYGQHMKELVQTIDRKYLSQEIEPQIGMQLQIGEHEEMTVVTITKVTDDAVTLDANHPMAGKTLNFEIELVDIQ